MSFWKRMFSADYRRGLAAEATGDYLEAASAYALSGERHRVAEMHLLRAEGAENPELALGELRAALRWTDLESAAGRSVRHRIARALQAWARTAGVVSDRDRQVLREAAGLFSEVGDHAAAGACHELIGEELRAAEAYQRAGEIDRLEQILDRDERRRRGASQLAEAWEAYRLELARGERDRALDALDACLTAAAAPARAEYRRLRQELAARLRTGGGVRLGLEGRDVVFVGAFPLRIGRDAGCALILREAGVSRFHARIDPSDGGFLLTDLDSKNGTTLGGIAVGAPLPLPEEGRLGLGEHCELRFSVADRLLSGEVVRGIERGLQLRASAAPMVVTPETELRFLEGRPRLSIRAGVALRLNGAPIAGSVQLVGGDLIEIGDRRIEVR